MTEICLIDLFANIGSLYHAVKDYEIPAEVIFAHESDSLKACVLVYESEMQNINEDKTDTEVGKILAACEDNLRIARESGKYKKIVGVASLLHLIEDRKEEASLVLCKCLLGFSNLIRDDLMDHFVIYTTRNVMRKLQRKLESEDLELICNQFDFQLKDLGLPIDDSILIVTDRRIRLNKFADFLLYRSWQESLNVPEDSVMLHPSVPEVILKDLAVPDNLVEDTDYKTELMYPMPHDKNLYSLSGDKLSLVKPEDMCIVYGFKNITLNHSWIKPGELRKMVATSVPPLVHRLVLKCILRNKGRVHSPIVYST